MTAVSTNNLDKDGVMWDTHQFDTTFCDGLMRLGFEEVVIFLTNGNPINLATIPKKSSGAIIK